MPLPIDNLIVRLEAEHQTSIDHGYSPTAVYTYEECLKWAREEKAAHEKLNTERWAGVEPLPVEAKLKIAESTLIRIKTKLPNSEMGTGLTDAIGKLINEAIDEMAAI